MRRKFAELLASEMALNKDIYVLTADIGYGVWDKVRDTFPDRYYNVGASEQLLIGAAIGLALSGKIPICYTITPFLLYRPFELLRTYINHERIPIILVGSGRDDDYIHDGFSHYAFDDIEIMGTLPNIGIFYPMNCKEIEDTFHNIIYTEEPIYINLGRFNEY